MSAFFDESPIIQVYPLLLSPFSRVRKSSFGVLSQVGTVQAGLALIPTYSKHPKLTALALTLVGFAKAERE